MNWNHRAAVLLMAATICLSTVACGARSASSTAAASPQMSMAEEDTAQITMDTAENAEDAQADSGDANTPAAPVESSRKLIRRMWLQAESTDFDGMTAWIDDQVTTLGGYIEESERNGRANDPGGRSAHYVARIPTEQVDSFVAAVGEKSNVTSKRENVEDVTLRYVDVESHKKALQVEQERLMALLEKADKLEDIIALEQRLSEVRYELEQYESMLRTYDNQIAYSTVTINLSEVSRITPAAEKTISDRMRLGFQQSLYDIGQGVQELAVLAVAASPYLIILAVVVLGVFFVVRRIVCGAWGIKKPGSGGPPAEKK